MPSSRGHALSALGLGNFLLLGRRRCRASMSSWRRRDGWLRGRGPVGCVGRVPPALQAHSRIFALCNLRVESTVAHDGEQARTDRTRRAYAGGSPSYTLNDCPYPNGIGARRRLSPTLKGPWRASPPRGRGSTTRRVAFAAHEDCAMKLPAPALMNFRRRAASPAASVEGAAESVSRCYL
jgi:hypothetical protein